MYSCVFETKGLMTNDYEALLFRGSLCGGIALATPLSGATIIQPQSALQSHKQP